MVSASDPLPRNLRLIAITLTLLTAACTLDNQTAPGLVGPSEFGLSVTLTAAPDQLPRDGSTQSVITVTTRNSSGGAAANQLLSLTVSPFGAASLSATQVTTDAGGSATVLLTAPSPGTVLPGNQLVIVVMPVTGNFANAAARSLAIGLTGAPNTTAPTPAFTVSPPNPQVRQVTTFDASLTRDEGAPCSDSCTYEWDFDDGSTGLGRQTAHAFTVARIHTVTLRVVDAAGTISSLRQVVNVSPVPAPVVTLTIAPNSPVAGQMATLTATAIPATGHSIQRYRWDFGDSTSQATTVPTVSHSYGLPGSYTATVTATDDLDQAGAASLHFIVTAGVTAAFTTSPLNPRVADIVTFNASSSETANGAAIVRYAWNFGDMSPVVTTSSPSTTHRFPASRTYVIQLTISDSQGRTATATQELRVGE